MLICLPGVGVGVVEPGENVLVGVINMEPGIYQADVVTTRHLYNQSNIKTNSQAAHYYTAAVVKKINVQLKS